jgi:NCS1 family nucleobase:cation symporter-1
MAAMAIWIFVQAGGSIAWASNHALEGAEMWRTIFAGGALWVSIYGTFVLNFCDFTRSAVSKKAVVRGNFWGIPINMLLFGAIVVVMAGGQFKINGTIIKSPSDIVQTIPNTMFLVLACLALLILTIAVNLMANFVAPVYALTNLFPKHLNFRKAAWVSGTIGLIILPWNLYNNPIVIVYFLGGLGALLGPLFGVVMADYWLLRRGKVNVLELYTEDPAGAYFYKKGFNPRAIIALVPAACVALLVAFVPALEAAAPFAWFVAAGIAAAVYYAISDRSRRLDDVDGEAIAVASNH